MLTEDEKKIEGLLKLALEKEAGNSPFIYEGSPCISNKIIDGFHTGKISDKDREEAYDHLLKCRCCRGDLNMYFELVGSKDRK